jgi:N-acetylneuraminic acid mutarotase
VTAGTVFTPRTGHECILADGLIFLFGGTDDEERLNDLYSYNIRANTWEKILTEGPVPLPRSGARGVAYMDGLYFFGGYQRKQGTYFNDLFYFDIDKKKWTVIC